MAAGLGQTPSAERVTIGIFGRTNAGKSSIFNVATGQDNAVVSDIKGTTTDPVQKAMEILPLGPVNFIDTPGLADDSALGRRRIGKTQEVLRRVDIALVVVDPEAGTDLEPERDLLKDLRLREVPALVIMNKADLVSDPGARAAKIAQALDINCDVPCFSVKKPECGITAADLRKALAALKPMSDDRLIIGGSLSEGDTVVLVIPIDESAPKGRLILPQVLVMREILDAKAIAVAVQPEGLKDALYNMKKQPRLVITDSQAFGQVSKVVPPEISLTSFSILMAGYKGDLPLQVEGVHRIPSLSEGSTILISEGCTHHRQCNDIGTKQIPAIIDKLSGHKLNYKFTSGGEFIEDTPSDSFPFDLIVHCGGCMLNAREMRYRMRLAREAGIPVTNYGVLMAYAKGILDRSIKFLNEEMIVE